MRSMRVVEWLGFDPNFWNRNALLSGFDYRVINNPKLGTNFNNLFFLLKGFCTVTHFQDCFKIDSSRRSSQKSACLLHRTSSHVRGSCSRGRVRLYYICFLIRSTYSHDREHHFGSCGIHGISDHNTCSSFEPDDGHISVLLFRSVAHDARR